MTSAFVIGGTRFIGRHLITELLANDYSVTMFNRGNHENPFEADTRVTHIEGDRTDSSQLAAAADRADPTYVFDCVAYYPEDVRQATTIFADVAGYVYISSGSAYGRDEIPKRENETPLNPCSSDQARDSSPETYGNRKAEGDRAVFAAAMDGLRAMSVRPTIVYGPYDYSERLNYWIDRVARYDEIVVPGDGTNIWHLAYVKSVAEGLRIVAEEGHAGEAYNVGDRRIRTLGELVAAIANALDTTVDPVYVSERESSAFNLALEDFILYRPYPHILDTTKLAALGWEPTSIDAALATTIEDYQNSDRDGQKHGPDRSLEEQILETL